MPTTRSKAKDTTPIQVRYKREKPASSREGSVHSERQPAKRPKTHTSDSGAGALSKLHATLERGHIYFLYRPKVATKESHDIEDVSNFQLLLVPHPDVETDSSPRASATPPEDPQNKQTKKFRLIATGCKRLSDPERVLWASVVGVGDSPDNLEEALDEQVYQTKTRGERHIQPARLAGRGVYAIYSPTHSSLPPAKRDQTYLAYRLSHPSPPGDVQSALGIRQSSSFVLQVKNFHTGFPPQVGLPREPKANFPRETQREEFAEGPAARWFTPANPTALLDHVGTELLLVGHKTEIGLVVGEEHAKEVEGAADTDVEELSTKQVISELLLYSEKFPAEAIEGHWI